MKSCLSVADRRRVVAAEQLHVALFGAAVGQDHDVAVLHQLGDDGIEVHQRVDVALLDRRDRAWAGADADDRDIFRLEPVLGDQRVDEEVGGGTGRRDADLEALQVLERLHLRGLVLLDREHHAGEAAELDHRLDVLALRLHADGVLVGAGDEVDRPADQRSQRFRSAAEVVDRHIQALLLEVAEPFRDRQRQVVEQPLAADAERDLLLFDRLRVRPAR